MKQTTFDIPKVDCPSEEKMIRMALDGMTGVQNLAFDLRSRQLTATHSVEAEVLLQALQPLGFGAKLSHSRELNEEEAGLLSSSEKHDAASASEAKVLWQLLAINGFMFVAEMSFGLYAQSAGLIADSLDMFADAAVYGLSLYAVGKAVHHKKRAARLSGYLQVLLALGALVEVLRRFVFGSEPEEFFMMGVAAVALAANALCIFLLSKHRDGEVHMKASWIFSTNDVIANLGVLLAGALVWTFKANWPDLAVGLIISVIVLRGGIRILRLSKS
ncbi:MAG: cation transporter [Bdellovibrionaceae bacterium]|nr:cation transporter [Pseudobdellovibrionaceae bacterium]